ncbi:hypothetical protein PP940_gp164 [Rhizobium phage RL2RES]|uniref:Uncharacterized protein n=1 Tax=Rhizobium phage RL2RES TaxID=103371 RepID=A0A6B9J247_9CAUD|nr:hypothetical protein PP940_gp164 [Rhizobium phage RL2RES]QGZ14347.1 hypothetical protein RL2RES_164 [Rhizobium phage RL2RES]
MFKRHQHVRVKKESSAFHKYEGYVDEVCNGNPEFTYTFKYVVKLDDWHTPLSFAEEELEHIE